LQTRSKSKLPAVPSSETYKQAFLKLRNSISEKQMQMLRAHYRATNHSITATDLAKAAGYKSFQTANLQYGKLGRKLRDVMEYTAEGQASYVLASFLPPNAEGNTEWLLIMHAEVAGHWNI
jgi:hypothetical protein